MVATVKIYEYNRNIGVETKRVTALDLISADKSGGSVVSYPITLPTSGLSYSFEKWFRLVVTKFSGAPVVKNFRVWLEIGEGQDLTGQSFLTNLTTSSYTASSYVTPAAAASVTSVNAMPTTDPGTPNIGINGSLSGEITNLSVLDRSDLITILLTVSTSALSPCSGFLKYAWSETA
jgi:hypothetical protein